MGVVFVNGNQNPCYVGAWQIGGKSSNWKYQVHRLHISSENLLVS